MRVFVERREFIKKCSISALGMTGASSLLTACQTNEVRQNHSAVPMNTDRELIVSKASIAKQQYVLLKHPEQSQPICLIKTGVDQYTAILMSCTHQKCTTQVADSHIICPCHGARFSHKGEVLRGPAERDLTTYKTRISGDEIFIALA